MDKNPNPQGKGGSPVLAALSGPRAALAAVPAKPMARISTELFTSLFVLDSEFRFRPVPGKPYFLYHRGRRYRLAITPPSMWHESISGRFIGTCELQPDMTWTLALTPAMADDEAFQAELASRRQAFEQDLAAAATVDDVLPVHEPRYAFHRRAAAFALAHSQGRSLQRGGLSGLSYDRALGQLAHAPGGDD